MSDDETQKSRMIYDYVVSANVNEKNKKQKLRQLGKLSRPTQLLVADLKECRTQITDTANLKKMDWIIKEAEAEGFHDFYASEDSDGDTKDAFELVLMLKGLEEKCTKNVEQWAKEGKYDAEKGDEEDL